MATSTQPGANNQGVINAPNKQLGIIQMDMQITSTLTTALNIEILNAASSQFKIANSGVNNYQPVSGNPGTFFATGTANQYGFGNVSGVIDVYTNANATTPDANTTTKNMCYWDANGNAVYQPGYTGGALPAGNVVISITLNNASYRQFFDWTDQCCNVFDFWSWKTEYSELSQQISTLEFRRKNIQGKTLTDSITPKTSKSEDQFNPLLLTCAINKRMTRQDGWQYNVLPFTQGNSMVISSSLFIQPLTFSASAGKFIVNKNF